jgi:Fe-S oxidoreductase
MSLADFRYDIDGCLRCSLCKWVDPWSALDERFLRICPSIERYTWDAYSAQGRLDIAKAVAEGKLDPTESETITDIVYQCTMCGGCDTMCKRSLDLDVLESLKALREHMWDKGLAPTSLRDVAENIKKNGSVRPAPGGHGEWAEGLGIKDAADGDVDVLLLGGCGYSGKDGAASPIRAVVGLLQKAEVNFGVLGARESCCGAPLTQIGAAREFVEVAKKNIEQFAATGASVVVVPCADCYAAIKVDYARVAHKERSNIPFEVLSGVEFLERLVDEGKLKPVRSQDLKVTWHDPCRLGRLSEPYIPWEGERGAYGAATPKKELRRGTHGCYDPPRNIITVIPGIELVEMARNRENTWCCGAGGGVKDYDPAFTRWTADQRIEEALATGADALLTACPWCEAALGEAAGDRIAVLDLAELIEKSVEEGR